MHNSLNVGLKFSDSQDPVWIGQLAWLKSAKQCVFEWSDEALGSPFNISPLQIPKIRGFHKAQSHLFGGLHSVFNDSLPDGFGMRVMDQALMRVPGFDMTVDVSPIDRLSWVGRFGVGALVYAPHTHKDSQEAQLWDLSKLAQQSEKAQLGKLDQLDLCALVAGGSAQGMRPKFWAHVSEDNKVILGRVPLVPKQFIPSLIKLAPGKKDKEEPLLEAACMRIAKNTMGLNVADVRSVGLGVGQWASIHTRFDRLNAGRVHVQTLSALLGHDHRALNLDWMDVFKVASKLGVSPDEQLALLSQSIFHFGMGIMDDHAKNLSFLMGADGQWKCAPAYDLAPGMGAYGGHAMSFMGQDKSISKQDITNMIKKCRLPADQAWVSEQIDRVRASQAELPRVLQELMISRPYLRQQQELLRPCIEAFNEMSSGVKIASNTKLKKVAIKS